MNSKTFSFNNHKSLRGTHALFSPSQGSYIRYDDEKIIDKIVNQHRAALGTEIHEFAAIEIELNHRYSNSKVLRNIIESYIYRKYYNDDAGAISSRGSKLINYLGYLPVEAYDAVKAYINDCVGYRMIPEQPLVFPGLEDYIRGTADAISFRNGLLRIHDLKTGNHKADIEQLEIYAALFCIEYGIKPNEIGYELRLYQIDGIDIFNPTVEDILPIIDAHMAIGRLIKENML